MNDALLRYIAAHKGVPNEVRIAAALIRESKHYGRKDEGPINYNESSTRARAARDISKQMTNAGFRINMKIEDL